MQVLGQFPDEETNPKRIFAKSVVERLRNAGFEAIFAGGCVRDLMLGLEPTDYDVATNALPDQVRGLFRRSLAVGASFGVIVVQGSPDTGDIEVATFRSDGEYLDGRRPDTIRFSTAREDAQRRDFTINGMFYDPVEKRIIDYVGGLDDLKIGFLRAIGNPLDRFKEDKLRLMRAVRFAARFDLKIDPETLHGVKSMAGEVNTVSIERIAQELRKMLPDKRRVASMTLLRETGLLESIIPEALPMIGLPQQKQAHPEADLWEHTLAVMGYLPGRPSFPLAFAAFLHDIGKPASEKLENGRRTFYGHETYGKQIASLVCSRLKLSTAEIQRVTWLVEFHQYLGSPMKLRESKLKKMLSEPGIDELLDLHEADALASTGDTSQVDYCRYYLKEEPQGPINPPLVFTGHDLARLGVKPGPIFKVILDKVREAQLERKIETKRDAALLAGELFEAESDERDRPI
ncbi:MAG: CCA tRNA nucleotidyltransferase [Planctomycetota bacterium]|nr:CCA tRNA nucleotidyltransferase [Planctomycetota bacterium]